MRNDTMKKKILENIDRLKAKIQPFVDELDLQYALLAQLDGHEKKTVQAAEKSLGLTEEKPVQQQDEEEPAGEPATKGRF